MANEIDIKINVDNSNAQSGVNAFKKSWTELSSAISVAKQGFEMVQQALDATVGAAVDYSNEIESMASITQTGTAETIKLVEAADDARVSYEAVRAAAKKMVDAGIQPSIENIANLADEYNAIVDPVERSNFAMEKFGARAGPEMAKLLAQGSAAILKSAGAVDGFAQTMADSEDDIKKYKAALDEWDDTMKQAQITVGAKVVPALNNLSAVAKFSGQIIGGLFSRSLVGQMLETSDTLNDMTQAMKDLRGEVEVSAKETADYEKTTRNYNAAQADIIASTEAYNKAIQNVNNALDTAKIERYKQANKDAFDALNENIDSVALNFIEKLDFLRAGGAAMQKEIEAAMEALVQDPGDMAAQKKLEDAIVKVEALKVKLGTITADEAAKNIADTLGLTLDEAKYKVQAIADGLAAMDGRVYNPVINISTIGGVGGESGGSGGSGTPGTGGGGGGTPGSGGTQPPKRRETAESLGPGGGALPAGGQTIIFNFYGGEAARVARAQIASIKADRVNASMGG